MAWAPSSQLLHLCLCEPLSYLTPLSPCLNFFSDTLNILVVLLMDVLMPSLVFMRYMRAAARVLTDAGKFTLAAGLGSMHKMVQPSGASFLTCLMW